MESQELVLYDAGAAAPGLARLLAEPIVKAISPKAAQSAARDVWSVPMMISQSHWIYLPV